MKRPTFNLVSILLLTALVATWLTYFRLKEETRAIVDHTSILADMSRELFVEDDMKFAMIGFPGDWWKGTVSLDVFLPEAHDYEIHVATNDIPPVTVAALPADSESASLAHGRYRISIREEHDEDNSGFACVLVDGKEVLRSTEENWRRIDKESSGKTNDSWVPLPTKTVSKSLDYPMFLYRKTFDVPFRRRRSKVPRAPGPGILVWIRKK